MCITAKRRENAASVKESTSSSVEIDETCVSKNLDETARLLYKKDNSGYKRQEERDYKGLQRARVALLVWLVHQPHCFPGETIVQESIVA